MKRERLTTIWSLNRHREVPVRIYYRVWDAGGCRILCLEQVEELSNREGVP